MSNELIEKVARALYAIEWSELGGPYDEQDEIDKTYWMRGATAAVNLVLEAAAERLDAESRKWEAEADKDTTWGDDYFRWCVRSEEASRAAAAIRQMKGESK